MKIYSTCLHVRLALSTMIQWEGPFLWGPCVLRLRNSGHISPALPISVFLYPMEGVMGLLACLLACRPPFLPSASQLCVSPSHSLRHSYPCFELQESKNQPNSNISKPSHILVETVTIKSWLMVQINVVSFFLSPLPFPPLA